ncbi:heptaprenylglyceryl phosphate synthase [Alkalicoccus urumqiensis]|uniref:Heptaprenylglyceryl phosphate synthase n=1 Tax=Alkalicoccus urumqiensis TaxID=1548213 RepID=A0A2P6MIX0_ALKUR|nr:heptaprenylglyceryl phosphate synthase [Alkalicoccus urumqiensis]PRO66231.1 heptaprenylglyceryl phosphate synthase [Alkalicoccus urumqiensis]
MKEYGEWRHVFKLDPAEELDVEKIEALCESGTDAVIIGGTDGVTEDNVLRLLMEVRRFSVACVLEVSELEAVVPGFDSYLIPSVLNAGEPAWINGIHHEALKLYGHLLDDEELLAEGYVILNPEAKAARATKAETGLDLEDIEAYARMADQLFHLPVFYLEYSGIYGDPEVVKTAKSVLKHARLFYGGGISTPEQAREMALYADTVVVGDVIYDNFKQALKTVRAVQEAEGPVY